MMDRLDEIERYLHKALSSYRGEDVFEDALQEGLIRAWKDIQEGNEDFSHVTHRARQWARNFARDSKTGRRQATGAGKKTLSGRVDPRGEATRAKISQYVSEYTALHDKEPTNVQVSQGTGLSTSVVGTQRKNLREGRNVNHAIYADYYGENRIDYSAYTVGHWTDETQDFIFSFESVSWEEDTVADLDFQGLLEQVDPNHREVLYWTHVLGLNAKEVGNMYGLKDSNGGKRRIDAAHKAVRHVLNPEEAIEWCHNGHTRTEHNTKTTNRSNGRIYRKCLDCAENTRVRQSSRRKPKNPNPRGLATHCKRDHEIRGFKSGRRYCKVCNKLNQNPGLTLEGIPQDSKVWNWDEAK